SSAKRVATPSFRAKREISIPPLADSFHLLDETNLFQGFQGLDDQFQRHRTVLRRNRVANLLGGSLPIFVVQHFVHILVAASPQPFVTQHLRLGHSRLLRLIPIPTFPTPTL